MDAFKSNLAKANILIVDDTLENLNLLSNLLVEEGYRVRKAIHGSLALMGVQAEIPDLILLDIMMPDMDGYEVCRRLKADPKTQDIPVIFLSALHEALDKVKAFQVGGADYITKPFQVEEVLVRVKHQLTLQAAKAEISKLNQELEQRVQQRTAQLEAANRTLEQEISKRQQAQEQLRYMAFHDSLTGLPNRVLFMNRLEQAMLQAKEGGDDRFAVLFLDCDRFKLVNDSFGHLVGDQLLIAVAQRLQHGLRSADMIARLGGDEFAILLEHLGDIQVADAVAERLQQELQRPFWLDGHEIFISASIGIVLGIRAYEQPEIILRDADTAMYRAKDSGKARYQIFNSSMHHEVRAALQLETDLRLALKHQELRLHYQPIVAIATDEIIGFEALLRWQHPERGNIPPSQFVPIAEETGLIVPMGIWVLQEACRQFQVWQQQGLIPPFATISVNLSAKQFSQPDFIAQVDAVLLETGLKGASLKLEITESTIMENDQLAMEILQQLRERQIQLSIDDFGTGYSCLSSLYRFPVNTLKIDRSFVSRMEEGGQNLEIVQAIASLAHHLGMTVTAEGIETAEQLRYLDAMSCEFGQGYFYSRPLPPEAVATILQNTNPMPTHSQAGTVGECHLNATVSQSDR